MRIDDTGWLDAAREDHTQELGHNEQRGGDVSMSLLTVKQVAVRLGVAPATVYSLCSSKQLAHQRIGVRRGAIRVREEDLQMYMQQVTVPGVPAEPSPVEPARRDPIPPGAPAGPPRFQHVQWQRLPGSPPGAAERS